MSHDRNYLYNEEWDDPSQDYRGDPDLLRTPMKEPSSKNIGVKHDHGKDRWELLMEMDSAEMVCRVLTYGANTKYSRGNYKHVKGWRWRYIGAAFRHMRAYLRGEKIDPDTGLPHLAHAVASLLMALDNEINDRPNGDEEQEKVK